MKIIIINGNPKKTGFISDSLKIISDYLISQKIDAQTLFLEDCDIKDCLGCFNCLRTGVCVHKDDIEKIKCLMLEADGYVIGAEVRNGLMPSLYKRFYERITYTLGFPLLLENKYTLGISCVGCMGGKKINRKFLGLQDVFKTKLTDYLFFKVGIPTKLRALKVKEKLESGADRLISDIKNKKKKKLKDRILFSIDKFIMQKILYNKNPELYANIIKCIKKKKKSG